MTGASLSTGVLTAATTCKCTAKDLFGEDLLDVQGATWAIGNTLEWRSQTISVDSLSDPLDCLMRLILWELYELNFRYELLALDQVMVRTLWEESLEDRRNLFYGIFPEDKGFVMWSSPVPKEGGGMWGRRFKDIFPYVEKFHELLSCWEGAPARLSAPLDVSTFDANVYFQATHRPTSLSFLISIPFHKWQESLIQMRNYAMSSTDMFFHTSSGPGP
ncbi:hypothetical protein BDR04DRAFT_1153460 [Suillus decipiens]|nr:hypothetical protein BDR04DRAFT_1153460 [Suillus decipiens]